MTTLINKPEDLTNRILAVDGDIIAYRTASVCEEHFEKACDEIIHTTLKNIATDTGIENMRIYISGKDNFRYKVAKTKPYKGNRATMVAPQFLNYCKEFLIKEYKAVRVHGYEADDGIATDMTQNNAIHCGIDKDMLQIAGLHYNYVKLEWYEVTPEDAIINLYRQILMGDTSDNIPGLPRVGAKTAEGVIADHRTAVEDALLYYETVCADKLPEVDFKEYFKEQSSLITMVKNVDFLQCMTAYVEADTQGFDNEEGDFDGIDEEPKPRVNIKL
jgi:5'-3' exonuclease